MLLWDVSVCGVACVGMGVYIGVCWIALRSVTVWYCILFGVVMCYSVMQYVVMWCCV